MPEPDAPAQAQLLLLQALLLAAPGPKQQRMLEALHCHSSNGNADAELSVHLGSPACVARLLLLASDAELMSGGDHVRLPSTAIRTMALLYHGSTLLCLYFTVTLWYFTITLPYYAMWLDFHQVRLLTATLLVKLAREVPTASLLAHGQNELCAFAEAAMATGDTSALGAGLEVLSTVQATLAHAAATTNAATADGDCATACEGTATCKGGAAVEGGDKAMEMLITTHRTRVLLRTLRADGSVGEAVREQARRLQHASTLTYCGCINYGSVYMAGEAAAARHAAQQARSQGGQGGQGGQGFQGSQGDQGAAAEAATHMRTAYIVHSA